MRTVLCFFTLLFYGFFTANAQSSWTKGNGTPGNPYQIENVAHLQYLAEQVNKGNTYADTFFILTNHLDLSSVCGINGSDTVSWTPIGNEKNPFKGVFKGGNHTINNLFICNTYDSIKNSSFSIKLTSCFSDTIYHTGPYIVTVKIISDFSFPIQAPMLKYIAFNSKGNFSDSIIMSSISGDSIWMASIPSSDFETKLVYHIVASGIDENSISLQDEFYIRNVNVDDSNSVAMLSFNRSDNYTMFNSLIPVDVTIKNKGLNNLKSANIGWSVNGINQKPVYWTGDLPIDETVNVCLGSYLSGDNETFDTVLVWIDNPNNVSDLIQSDDTISIYFYNNCSGSSNGTFIIGSSDKAQFNSVMHALTTFINNKCVDKDICLKIETGTYTENIDLSNLAYYFKNHSLTIASLANHPDSVILNVPSGVLFTLNNTDNLYINNLTLDVANTGTYAVQFCGKADNVEIRNCKIFANPQATSSEYGCIYNTINKSYMLNNIRIVGNNMDGGFENIHLYGGTISNYSFGLRVDSNICSNAYRIGIGLVYTDILSVSHNIVYSRTDNITGDFFGIYLKNSTINLLNANSINIKGIANRLYSIYLYEINSNVTNSALIVNNEVNAIANGNYSYGMYIYNAKANIYHNSIYLRTVLGGGTGIHHASVYPIVLKNNMIVCSTGQVPFNGIPDVSDYNNLYSENFSLSLWQLTSGHDKHSLSMMPTFKNATNNLELSDYSSFVCPRINDVITDIKGMNRPSVTNMGAYAGDVLNSSDLDYVPIKEIQKNLNKPVGHKHRSLADVQKDLPVISPDSVFKGLFGYIKEARIEDLHLVNTYINSVYFVGALSGCADSLSSVLNCSNSGFVKGDYYIGGLLGRSMNSTLNNCVNTGWVQGYAAIGGLCGDVRNDAVVSTCVNAGMVKGSSASIGGILGIIDSATISHSINVATVKGPNLVGAIVGKENYSIINNCIYDKQLCVKKAIGQETNSIGTDDIANNVVGKLTTEMLSDAQAVILDLPGNQSWVYEQDMYPRPKGIENTDVALVSAIPVFLKKEEHIDSVFTDFIVGKGNDSLKTKWLSSDTIKLTIDDTLASIACGMRNDTLSISTKRKDAVKSVYLRVTNPTEKLLRPAYIHGTNAIDTPGYYTFYVDPVKGATSYVWYVSNNKWVGKSTTNSITLYVKDSGSVVISVKALNKCYETILTELKVHSYIEPVIPKYYIFSMDQNIPNPVKQFTKIPYHVPDDGNVLFQLTTVSGQVLFTEELKAKKGENMFEINLEQLSSAVYFYTMEYKGIRLEKKLSIQK